MIFLFLLFSYAEQNNFKKFDQISEFHVSNSSDLINIPNSIKEVLFETSNISSLPDHCFENYTQLVSINIDFLTNLKEIPISCFANCTSLYAIRLPPSLLIIQPFAFYNCSSLSNILIPKKLEAIHSFAFAYTNITLFDFPRNIKYIGLHAFFECNSLYSFRSADEMPHFQLIHGVLFNSTNKSIFLFPPGLRIYKYKVPGFVTNISPYAFECAKISYIIFPYSLTTISSFAFSNSLILTLTIIPSVKIIEEFAFANMPHLKSVKLFSALKTLPKNVFSNTFPTFIQLNQELESLPSFEKPERIENIIVPRQLFKKVLHTEIPKKSIHCFDSLHVRLTTIKRKNVRKQQ